EARNHTYDLLTPANVIPATEEASVGTMFNMDARGIGDDLAASVPRAGFLQRSQKPNVPPLSAAELLADMIKQGRIASIKEVEQRVLMDHFFLKDLTRERSKYLRDRMMAMVAPYELNPEDSQGVKFEDARKLPIISVLLDTGCLCGPPTDLSEVQQILNRDGVDFNVMEKSGIVSADLRFHIVHAAIAPWLAAILLREGFPLVDRGSLRTRPHFLSGFTGGSKDCGTVVIAFRLWLMDRRTGLLHLTPAILGYVVPGWQDVEKDRDNLGCGLGEITSTGMRFVGGGDSDPFTLRINTSEEHVVEVVKFCKTAQSSFSRGPFDSAGPEGDLNTSGPDYTPRLRSAAPSDETVTIRQGETRQIRVPLPLPIGTRVQIDLISSDRSRLHIPGYPLMTCVTHHHELVTELTTVKTQARLSGGVVTLRVTVFENPSFSTNVQAKILSAEKEQEREKKKAHGPAEAAFNSTRVRSRGIDTDPRTLDLAREEVDAFLKRFDAKMPQDERVAEAVLQWIKH
ncbi:unnamed protein product, partial [Amoebophrya sp. A25]